MIRLPRLNLYAIGHVLPVALLASILLHALEPGSGAPATALGSTFRADTANICVAAGLAPQLAKTPLKRAPDPIPGGEPLVCGAPPALSGTADTQPDPALIALPQAAPSHRRGGAAPRAPPRA